MVRWNCGWCRGMQSGQSRGEEVKIPSHDCERVGRERRGETGQDLLYRESDGRGFGLPGATCESLQEMSRHVAWSNVF